MITETVRVAVDMAVFTVRDNRLWILMIRRGKTPYEGMLALPGGFLEPGEDLDQAAYRELTEETSVLPEHMHLEQFHSYGSPGRDPRGRVVAVAYFALIPTPPTTEAGGDAAEVEWTPVDDLLRADADIAFDHRRIVADAVERVQAKLEHTTVATRFCGEIFTISQLRQVYEAVWDRSLDPANFYRKVTKIADFVVSTGQTTSIGGGRPAGLYRAGDARTLEPPMYRPR
ncbi:8-oxo-dGTP diphosphatase [Stackebrandtia endophytica]|uniref:8-oxo-dGTP diphosphatase n=1 Tax=Stackebrandtia endophytica TaxID=1496996 RepID=A0A543AU69_9ACTN|nr:NUDIX domain-containing protein [Stackebrandtia endophytica]TQL76075.1 8-oxo-dGTP diphosphatase [Stackebrandtia endophytica]